MADFVIIKARTKYTGKVSENDRFMAGIIRTNYGVRIVPKPEEKHTRMQRILLRRQYISAMRIICRHRKCGRSRFANEKRAQGASDYQAVQIGTFGLGNFSDGEQEEMLEVCDMLEKHLPKACPTMEELAWAYGDVLVPVGAGSEDDEK